MKTGIAIILAILTSLLGAMADKFNITSVNVSNGGCDATFFPGGQIDIVWQTSNQTAASQAICYVGVHREGNINQTLVDDGIGSQVPCSQGSLSINITSTPVNSTSSWGHVRAIAGVYELSPFSGHNNSCSFVIMDPVPEICPYYPCKVALIGTFVPVGVVTIIACCACHKCWWKPKRIRDKSKISEEAQ